MERINVSELSDAEFNALVYDMAQETEARIMRNAGEPIMLTAEEEANLPF